MLKLSIVLAIFNGLEFTKNCLKLLKATTENVSGDIQFSIIVVDDGSFDNSAEWIRNNYPEVQLLNGNGNLWWSGGINMAVNHAIEKLNSDYIVWWNNDITPDENYFQNLGKLLKDNDTNTIIGSKTYYAHQKDMIWSMGGLFDPKTGFKDMVGTKMIDNENFQEPIEVDWLPGMGTVTHRSVYNKIGMLDERNFPQYHGDSDFTFKAKQNGFKIVVYPTLKIYNDISHSGLKHNESFSGLLKSMFTIKSNYNIKKDFLFYKKYAGSYKAYSVLIGKYGRYIGGFFKWKIFSIFGVKR